MKITFEVEKVLKYKKVEVELTESQIKTIQEKADERGITFAQAFHRYSDQYGVMFDIMWDRDEDYTEYEIWDVEVMEK